MERRKNEKIVSFIDVAMMTVYTDKNVEKKWGYYGRSKFWAVTFFYGSLFSVS